MKEITTRTATIIIDENKVLHMIMLKDIKLDYEDALDNALVIKRLTENKQVLKLIDARLNFTIDKKARQFINNVDIKQTIARAVVKNSALSTLILNFFTKLNKPQIPTKLFTDINEAYNWLMTFKASGPGAE